MSSLLTDGDLTHEEHVVWLEDPEHLDYVRQALGKTGRRNTNPPLRARRPDGRVRPPRRPGRRCRRRCGARGR